MEPKILYVWSGGCLIITAQSYCMVAMFDMFDAPLPLLWRHNGRDGASNHQPDDCLLNRSFRRRSKKTSKHRVTGLCAGNSPGTGEFSAQMASDAENAIPFDDVIMPWHHVGLLYWDLLLSWSTPRIMRARGVFRKRFKGSSFTNFENDFYLHFANPIRWVTDSTLI